MSYYDDYIGGIATALWGDAWATWQESLDSDDERSVNLSGAEITDIMPPIPDEVKTEAAVWLGRMIEKIGSNPFHSQLREVIKNDHTAGFLLAMQMMGAGVSVNDNYELPRYDLPCVENPFNGFYDGVELNQ